MSGWQRVAVIALIAWWSWCGFVAASSLIELRRLGETHEYYGDELAVLEALDETGHEANRRDARSYLASKANLNRAAMSAVFAPLAAYILFVIARWVVAGFKRPERPEPPPGS